jgi:hypothetical protein
MSAWRPIVLKNYPFELAAYAAALEGSGIPVIRLDHHYFAIDPGLTFGIIGPRLLVPGDRWEEATALLKSPIDTGEPIHACPRCNGATRRKRRPIFAILAVLFGEGSGMLGPVFDDRRRRCGTCRITIDIEPAPPFTADELQYPASHADRPAKGAGFGAWLRFYARRFEERLRKLL